MLCAFGIIIDYVSRNFKIQTMCNQDFKNNTFHTIHTYYYLWKFQILSTQLIIWMKFQHFPPILHLALVTLHFILNLLNNFQATRFFIFCDIGVLFVACFSSNIFLHFWMDPWTSIAKNERNQMIIFTSRFQPFRKSVILESIS